MSCTRTGIATAPIAAFLKYLLPIESVFDCFIDIACIILGCHIECLAPYYCIDQYKMDG